MAQPSPNDLLTASELRALYDAFTNDALMAGLRKVFQWESREESESMEAEALRASPNIGKIIQHAACTRQAREFQRIIELRVQTLTPQGQR